MAARASARPHWLGRVWVHLIDIDMGQRISMLKPIKRGKERCLGLLAAHFLGDAK